mmetsp:Transcript_34275/g.73199  ORF Transcript_34275/g.73199 Transcript_34275/m.73199 type:complete len:226 (-) Transcript_34275:299-976(-)
MGLRTLYGEATSRVTKVMWIAAEAGISYARVIKPVAELKREAAYLRRNPKGTVPTWTEELGRTQLVLNESNTIVAYIAQQYGQDTGLYPSTAGAVAQCWQWQEFGETSLQPVLSPVWWGMVKMSGYPPGPGGAKTPIDQQRLSQQQAKAFNMLKVLDTHLSDGRLYMAGDRLTFGDITCGVHANRLFHIPQLVTQAGTELPHVLSWYHRLLLRPAYAEHVKPNAG